ncbi:Exosome component 5 [Terramyces sp. JEL0728]|nr:Exosome component 5 [Terramyces sp. JEL0728]
MRPDQRTNTSVRTMGSGLGYLSRSDGSAKFQFGKSSVLCAVNGPMPVKQRDELMDKAFISVSFTPLAGKGTTLDRLYERILEKIATSVIIDALHPRTMIKINFQVLADDGSILTTGINAMMLALLDAGVPLNSTFAGVTTMLHNDGRLLLDPTLIELAEAQSVHNFVFDAISGNCITTNSTGVFTKEEFDGSYELGSLACQSIHGFFKAAVKHKIEKEQGKE